ncbi:mRNA 3'-end-processing protein yth-1 [Magnaporthiopsis poae ATCC 64411]|uniref:mRNA 3'-end-processing protein n=1 Tax=Magnaporthiopsis poae (strain ATCC 64411 / 73-15) TaxID=644358 RepID=A0A0C4E4T6_MAGP6|nr:mRNA 3'-end-processing protein yth-1 [Magnaporthiopsis poae ATCC 64411]
MAPSVAKTVEQMLSHAAPHYSFSFTPFLQQTYQHSLPPDRPICRVYASGGNCANGTRCLERHVSDPSSTADNNTTTQGGRGKRGDGPAFNSMVCKHWLRGLCKKGDSCEFLHEYNLRKMPECNFYLRHGFCQNGEECMYLHIDPQSKLPPCPHYDQGFCPLGPRCAKKHVRRQVLCPYYLCGFCPDGRACKQGAHPRWDPKMEKPTVKVERPPQQPSAVAAEDEMGQGQGQGHRRDGHFDDDDDRDGGGRDRDRKRGGGYGGQRDKFGGRGGGGGGRWGGRGGGGHKFRGRNF